MQEKLVAIPALGPDNQGSGEKAKSDFVRSYLQDMGVTDITEVHSPDARVQCGYRPNFVAKIEGKNPHKTLWIITHLDVVPPGDSELWNSDPFQLEIQGDLIFGRGVEDNHQGMTSSFLVAKAFLDLGINPDINLGLILVSDEETGNKYGLPYVLDERPDLFSTEDLFLVPDFGSSDSDLMEVAEKSMLWVKISAQGKQCHASTPDRGINSLVACSALVLKMEELNQIFPMQNELFKPSGSTFCPTKKEANVPNVNTIPGLDIFYVDCRVLPEYSLTQVFHEIRKLGSEIEEQYNVRIDYETILQEESAPYTSPSSEVVVKLGQSIEQVYSVRPTAQGVGGGTVASFLRRRGYDAVVWATLMGTAHQPNECASIENIIKDAQVMALMAVDDGG